MHLTQVMAGAAHGGAETFFTTLAVALEADGVTQSFILRNHPDRVATLRAAGCRVDTAPFGGRLDLWTPQMLRRSMMASRTTVAMAWMNRAAAKLPRGPWLRTARLGGYYDLKYYKGFDHLIAIIPGIRRHILDGGWPERRVHYIPNFCVVDETAAPVSRADLGTPADAPLLLALGRLHPAKGLDVLLQAVADVPGAHLWIAGEGPDRADLEALAAALGVADRVRFLGWRSDRTALMRAADVVVFPSRYEPNGTVTVEAWAHDKPLVVADAAGPAEMVRNGEDALLVPKDDADALARALRRVLDSPDLAAHLVGRGAERVAAEFSQASVIARYRAFLDQMERDR
ncbi:glycosyltransferase [Roseospira marina]|uniref:Glycosyltransferase n=1 Tax=Roseospira marina TaxID=140057 RepID=A0A5M6IED5_9PROT|nr:glycosyltransferase [Roseospira marina]KAA5606641.1 glycosyltransferase [Roseospira marina]MBB4313954.1 glycosyltransferase involved in cell wall biosynthesis [Roseospira marina]MBB5087116.1 glycosyltransferase involved in cell wall biosynthesis [Roseospira marina]